LPWVDGDPVLLRQVFVNLLHNALKFTRTRVCAVIEVNEVSVSGARALRIQDNGVGFSMQHAGRLFGVFQRLHGADEFEGTGIGLATVQRIARKHGWRVWCDAAIDRGATFYLCTGAESGSEAMPG